jgi:YggT family protein
MIRVILSWTGFNPDNPFHSVVHEITEPILGPLRQIIPRVGMFDLSPMAALIVLSLIFRASLSLGG